MQETKEIWVDIDTLKPYENNPRKIEAAIDGVANSLKEFDFINPIIINKDNKILAGHTRLEAAKKNGLKKVLCKQVTHLTPEQEKHIV